MTKQKSEAPHPIDKSVGRLVAQRRIELGYSQSDLGRALNLTFQQIQKYEKGTNRISASKLWEASRFLDVDVSHFFGGSSRPEPLTSLALPTRYSVEANRLMTQLKVGDQKLILAFARRLEGRTNDSGEETSARCQGVHSRP